MINGQVSIVMIISVRKVLGEPQRVVAKAALPSSGAGCTRIRIREVAAGGLERPMR